MATKKKKTTPFYLSEKQAAALYGRSINAFRVAVKLGRAPAPAGKLGARGYWIAPQFDDELAESDRSPDMWNHRVIGVKDIAAALEVSARTVDNWRSSKQIRMADGMIGNQSYWKLPADAGPVDRASVETNVLQVPGGESWLKPNQSSKR